MKILLSLSAVERDFSATKITELAHTIAQHLVYCYLYPHDENLSHWVGEITSALEKVYNYSKLKGGKFIKSKHLHKYLFNTALDNLEELKDLYRFAIDHNNNKPVATSMELAELYATVKVLYAHLENSILNRSFLRSTTDAYLKDYFSKYASPLFKFD
jgi:hypothetical protein